MARLIFFLVFASISFLSAQLLPKEEKIAIRREMIEKDIAIRNIASLLAMGEPQELARQFAILSGYQMLSHPLLGEVFQKVLTKWKKQGTEKYFQSLQKKAHEIKEILQKEKKPLLWDKVQDAYLSILADCRNCHESSGVVVQDE